MKLVSYSIVVAHGLGGGAGKVEGRKAAEKATVKFLAINNPHWSAMQCWEVAKRCVWRASRQIGEPVRGYAVHVTRLPS